MPLRLRGHVMPLCYHTHYYSYYDAALLVDILLRSSLRIFADALSLRRFSISYYAYATIASR